MQSERGKVPVNQVGPELLSYFLNWALLGVLTVQVYLYHVNMPQDPLLLKCLVYIIYILEWLSTANMTSTAMRTFITSYGQGDIANTVRAGWMPLPIVCAIASLTTQYFFAWRIYKLSKRKLLISGIVLLSVIQAVCGLITGISFIIKDGTTSSTYLADKSALIVTSIWMGGSAFVDILIAVVMTALMLKRKTGILAADRMINKVIRLVVETGTLTASVASAALVLAIVSPATSYFQLGLFTMTKLYANTLLTNLINRMFLVRDFPPRGVVGEDNTGITFTSVLVNVTNFNDVEESIQLDHWTAQSTASQGSGGYASQTSNADSNSSTIPLISVAP